MDKVNTPPIKIPSQLATRNRAKQRAYIGNGIRKFPASALALLALIGAVAGIWSALPMLAAYLITISPFVFVFAGAFRVSAILVATLLWAIFLYLIGRPRKAREIENDLATVFGVAKSSNSQFYRCPFLVSCRPVKGTAAKEFVFWSRWQGLDRWNKPEIRQAVLWALNVHSEEDFTPGSKPYTVKIRAVSGAVPEKREFPKDPLF